MTFDEFREYVRVTLGVTFKPGSAIWRQIWEQREQADREKAERA